MSASLDLEDLGEAGEQLARALAARQAAAVAEALRRRGSAAERLLRSAPAGLGDGERLKATIEAGRQAALNLQAQKQWLVERLKEAREARRSRGRLEPYRETRGRRVDVRS